MAASGSSTWRAAATSSCRLDWLRCKVGGGGGDASTNKLSRDSLWPVRRRRPSAFVARNRHRSAASAIGSRRPAPSTTWQPGSHRRSCTSFWSSSPRAWRIVATMTSVLSSSSASSSAGRSTAVGSNLRADQIWNVRICDRVSGASTSLARAATASRRVRRAPGRSARARSGRSGATAGGR